MVGSGLVNEIRGRDFGVSLDRYRHLLLCLHSNSSTVMPAPVRLQNQEGRPPMPSAPDSGTDKMDIKSTLASNPKGLSLSKFDKLFKRNGMKLVTAAGNGFCFISCVLVTLTEQGINKSLDVLSVEIMIEITNHLVHYKQYGNKRV